MATNTIGSDFVLTRICELCHKPAKHILFVDGLQDKYNVEYYCFCSFKCLASWLVCTEIDSQYIKAEINKMIDELTTRQAPEEVKRD